MIDQIGTILAIVCAFVAKELYEAYKKHKMSVQGPKNMVLSIAADILINDELSTLRDKFGFNRAAIYDFSNGTHSLAGISFKNISMRYERVDLTTKPIMKLLQLIPASNMAKLMKQINESGMVEVNTEEHLSQEHNLQEEQSIDQAAIQHQRMFGVNQTCYFLLGENLTLGCLLLSNISDHRVHLSQENINYIKDSCQRISAIRIKDKIA